MTIADFLIDTCEEALNVSCLIAFVCLALGNVVGAGVYAEAIHELHWAFAFASGLAFGLCLKRGR